MDLEVYSSIFGVNRVEQRIADFESLNLKHCLGLSHYLRNKVGFRIVSLSSE